MDSNLPKFPSISISIRKMSGFGFLNSDTRLTFAVCCMSNFIVFCINPCGKEMTVLLEMNQNVHRPDYLDLNDGVMLTVCNSAKVDCSVE